MCPADYRYSPAVFDRAPDFTAETLYVVGGLYGNAEALKEIERLAAAEPRPPAIVFNGDFHWFDADPKWFAEIDAGVSAHRVLRGNVESEIAREGDIGAGCGCAYPPTVDEGVVSRSNAILADLRATAWSGGRNATALGALPMHLVAHVGDCRIGIVHGDAQALAGWSFAHDALDDVGNRAWRERVHAQARVDVFASTHTCLAALRQFDTPAGRLTFVNNGAAGMANFAGDRRGLISRIGTAPGPHAPLYGTRHGALFIDALPIAYDFEAFLQRFLHRWPLGTPAHASYWERIVGGPTHRANQAWPG
jgi:hypothetical protein